MSVLVHWIPALAAGFILAIAGFVVDWRIQVERRARVAQGETATNGSLTGVQFLFDERGERTAVLIDLRQNRRLWQELLDAALARTRPLD